MEGRAVDRRPTRGRCSAPAHSRLSIRLTVIALLNWNRDCRSCGNRADRHWVSVRSLEQPDPGNVEWNNLGTLPLPGEPMWTFSRPSTRPALTYAQLESAVLERTAELQTLSQRLLKVQDEEKRKLFRDLHDSTGQTLTALKVSISLLHEECKENPSIMLLASGAARLADQAIEEIRTKSYLPHPPLLDEVGFCLRSRVVRQRLRQANRGRRKVGYCNHARATSKLDGDCSLPRPAGELDECTSALQSFGG
jgi:signal transduction histidine kinase